MKRSLLFFLFLISFANVYSQRLLKGRVLTENHFVVSNVIVLNVRTQEKNFSNAQGEFIVAGNIGDEIRFVKEGYERIDVKISQNNYLSNGLDIILIPKAIPIEEVKLKPSLSGDLNKDSKNFNENSKKAHLNNDINRYVKDNPIEIEPPKFEAGQLSLLSISTNGSNGGVVGAITKLISKPKTSHKNNYAFKDIFLKEIKKETDLSYFENYGMSEYDFDIYLSYIDSRHQLYKRKFSSKTIQEILKYNLDDYLKLSKK